LHEALATGLTVIAADAPGNREWVTSPSVGWLARAGDAEAFSQCLEQAAMLDDAERGAFRTANRGLAEKRADCNSNIVLLRRAYERIEHDLRLGSPSRG
jgi:glycosyltransferase involved in cell wall biosynthesis